MRTVAGVPAKTERNREIWEKYVNGTRLTRLAVQYRLSETQTWRIIDEFRKKLPVGTVDAARQVDLERLDSLLNTWMASALEGDHKAALIVLKILERRGHIIGYDAPVKVDMGDRSIVLNEAQQQFLAQVEASGSQPKQITAN